MIEAFSITQRHYDTIIGQAQKNYPQEVGGFLGGDEEGLIQGIFPLFNMFLFNKTDTFVITSEDLERAHRFFAKHNLKYYGLYHSHPKGLAYPSPTDIKTGHKFHFIIGLRDPDSPIFNAFRVKRKEVIQLPISIVSTNNFSVVDIHEDQRTIFSDDKPLIAPKTMQQEANDLSDLMENIKRNEPKYRKMEPRPGEDHSDFSTSA